MKYVIENFSIYNAEDYARVNVLAWQQSYKGIVNDDFLNSINTEEYIEQLIVKLKNRINDNTNRLFLLKVDDKPVGVLGVRKSIHAEYKDCGELGAIYLLDSVKGQGFGRILFNKAVEELKAMGYTKMINGCLEGNPANSFYQHMGGKSVGNKCFNIPNGQELIENMYYYDSI